MGDRRCTGGPEPLPRLWDLGQQNNRSGINALTNIHEQNAGGSTQVLFADDDLYIMQRSGAGEQTGLVLLPE